MYRTTLIGAGALLLATAGFAPMPASSAPGNAPGASSDLPQITRAAWGVAPSGQPVDIFTLRNAHGMTARITNYGGIVVSLTAPDRQGKFADVVLGFDTLTGYTNDQYLKEGPYLGALIGRYANRIKNAQFTLDGKLFQLAANNDPNHVHGGRRGFDKKVWSAQILTGTVPALELKYTSPDAEEGYPGELKVTVVYTLTNRDELKIDYSATTDRDTVVNLTNHSYFNLKGAGEGDILGHELMINARQFTPDDAQLIPTGEFKDVAGTPYDFSKPTAIGARIKEPEQQLIYAKGYNVNFVLNGGSGTLKRAARVLEPGSGRVLEVWTTQPGMELYTANALNLTGKGGKAYVRFGGFCLETQHFADSPNKPQFPSTVLKANKSFHSTTVFRFSTDG